MIEYQQKKCLKRWMLLSLTRSLWEEELPSLVQRQSQLTVSNYQTNQQPHRVSQHYWLQEDLIEAVDSERSVKAVVKTADGPNKWDQLIDVGSQTRG